MPPDGPVWGDRGSDMIEYLNRRPSDSLGEGPKPALSRSRQGTAGHWVKQGFTHPQLTNLRLTRTVMCGTLEWNCWNPCRVTQKEAECKLAFGRIQYARNICIYGLSARVPTFVLPDRGWGLRSRANTEARVG